MREIGSGLIIREPWISKILAGEKRWEMRSTRTAKRERIALIRKKSGLIVGLASITGVLGPFDDNQIAASFERHRVPNEEIGNWRYAWVLEDVVGLERPIPYIHAGGVVWVTLDAAASENANAIG